MHLSDNKAPHKEAKCGRDSRFFTLFYFSQRNAVVVLTSCPTGSVGGRFTGHKTVSFYSQIPLTEAGITGRSDSATKSRVFMLQNPAPRLGPTTEDLQEVSRRLAQGVDQTMMRGLRCGRG